MKLTKQQRDRASLLQAEEAFLTDELAQELIYLRDLCAHMEKALQKLVAWRKGNTRECATSFGPEYLNEYLVNGTIGVTRKLEQEARSAIAAAQEGK